MLIDDVKLNLRITHNSMNSEVMDLIDAAKAQLKLSGIVESAISDTDAMIKRAIILYCKANFGLDNAESDKYQARLDSLISHLSMCPEYNTVLVVA